MVPRPPARRVLLALALVLLVAGGWQATPSVAQASDVVAESGPAWGDVAFRVNLASPRAPAAPPVVTQDHAFILTLDNATGGSVIYRLDFATAEVVALADIPDAARTFTTDAERFYVTTRTSVLAYDARDGRLEWSAGLVADDAENGRAECNSAVLAMGVLHVACDVHGGAPPALAPDPHGFIIAFDAETGERVESWAARSVLVGPNSRSEGPDDGQRVRGFTVVGGQQVALLETWRAQVDSPVGGYASTRRVGYRLVASDPTFSQQAWSVEGDQYVEMRSFPSEGRFPSRATNPVSHSGEIFMRFERGTLLALDPVTGRVRGEYAVGNAEAHGPAGGGRAAFADDPDNGGSIVATRDALFVSTDRVLQRFDRATGDEAWRFVFEEDGRWMSRGLTLVDGVLYGRSAVLDDGNDWWTATGNPRFAVERAPLEVVSTLHAFDAVTGERLWALSLPHVEPAFERDLFTVAHGVLVAAGTDGNVTVVGHTPASPTARASVSTTAPEPGDVVRVDLSESEAGLFGPVTRYRVDWGDGSSTEWRGTPEFTHKYADAGVYRAVFSVQNDAGQIASEVVTMRTDVASVGITGATSMPRVHPAWVTFLVLGGGLVVTAGVRAQRQRVMLATSVPRPGERFLRKYRVERELGRGAFGSAWLATRVKDDARVVVKQLHPEWAGVEKARNRFLREARILQELDHPHVTRVLDVERVGKAADAPVFIVMEYVDGGSVQALLGPGVSLSSGGSAWDDSVTQAWVSDPVATGVPVEKSVRIVADVLDALAHVHARGIRHRDVKPSNVLLTKDGRAKVADFGVAKPPVDAAATFASTAGGAQPGTLAYMAPEVIRGNDGDARADLYAVGVMFVHLVTGRFYLGARPADEFELRRAILERAPVIDEVRVPPALAAWARRALAKDPDARYPDAATMRAALEDAAAADARDDAA